MPRWTSTLSPAVDNLCAGEEAQNLIPLKFRRTALVPVPFYVNPFANAQRTSSNGCPRASVYEQRVMHDSACCYQIWQLY